MIKHYNDKIQNAIQKELFKANSSIKIAVAWFTNEMLLQPLILKLKTGVSVELIINDDDINRKSASSLDFTEFIEFGGILRWNSTKQLMHEKFCILDDRIVISGSYNWTNKAEFNKESITIFYDEDSTTKFFSLEFEELLSNCVGVEGVKSPTIYIAKGYIDDEGFFIDEFGAKYSGDRKVLIKGADVEKYFVDGQTETIGERAFYRFKHILEVVLPQSVMDIGKEAFLCCELINTIVLSEGLITIQDRAFLGCHNLKEIYIPKTLKSIGVQVFAGCKKLEKVIISSIKSWCNIDFNDTPLEYAHLYINDIEIKHLVIPNGITTIRKHAFHGASSILSVQFPKELICIEDYAFCGCGFSELSIPNTVTSIGEGAFSETKLKSIVIPHNLQEINGYTFEKCSCLLSIDIPSNVKAIYEGAFFQCTSLSKLNFQRGVTNIGDVAFWHCYQLSSIFVPSSVTHIGYNAFQTFNLSNVIVEESNRVYDSRNDCNAIIETATNKLIIGSKNSFIPDSVSIIGHHAFAGYRALTSIKIPKSVISIEEDAFNSTGILSITIPNKVRNIDYNTFYGCRNLKTVIIKGVETEIKHSFGDCISLEKIIVPKGSKEMYRKMLDDVPKHVKFVEEFV